jgi:hypothetical protein
MAGPTRFEINGERHYATDVEGKAYPSVTTILGKTASEHAKKMLSNWNAKNPGGKEKAAARGTAIHAAWENYIRGLPINLPDEYLPFWTGLDKHLDKFDHFIWSEKPLKPEWKFCTGSDGISRIWSHQYGFCGCPDLIGYRNSLAILVDFKTSNQPYCRWFPDKKDPSTRQNFGQAAHETLGVHIDCAQILVSTPEIDQSFLFHGDDLAKYRIKWLQKVRRYRELKAEESAELEANS